VSDGLWLTSNIQGFKFESINTSKLKFIYLNNEKNLVIYYPKISKHTSKLSAPARLLL